MSNTVVYTYGPGFVSLDLGPPNPLRWHTERGNYKSYKSGSHCLAVFIA